MHKTGSTSIQRNLASLPESPDWTILRYKGNANFTSQLYAMFGDQPETYHVHAKLGLGAAALEREGRKLRCWFDKELRHSATNVILSSETISSMSETEVRRMGDFIRERVDEVCIIGYVRHPVEYVSSWFQQRVKHGAGKMNLAKTAPRYRQKFAKFDRIFGAENVLLGLFDPRRFTGGCVVRDFCAKVGMPLPPGREMERINESLSREACGLLYAYRKFGPGFGVGRSAQAENRAIIRALFKMQGHKFRFAEELVAGALSNRKKGIAWMEDRMGETFATTAKRVDESNEITSEDDLLSITRTTCREFAGIFSAMTGVKVPEVSGPDENTVPPEEAAALVQQCRDAYARKLKWSLPHLLGRWSRREKVVGDGPEETEDD